MSMPNKVRIDKWLWSIRLYKTRTVASDACRSGRVKINGKSVKPSYLLEAGIIVTAKKREKLWVVKVLDLIEKRVGAPRALKCYEDLSPPVELRESPPSFFYKPSDTRKKGAGRPTKRERRDIDKFREEE